MLVAVDTGGTKTLIALFGADGQVRETIKLPTPKQSREYVELVTSTLQKNFSDMEVTAVVIALPGIVKNGVAVWCNNLKWKNFDAASEFEGVLGKAPVLIENDANLAGLAEARSLEPIPTSVLYVTISTGIGTGIITNGHIDPGLRYSEGGRTILEFENTMQEWERFASGKAIRDHFKKYAREITLPNDWKQIADRISRGLLTMIPVIQPDVIIVGGSIGTYFEQYGAELDTLLDTKLPAHIPTPKLLQAAHPEEAVVYGCYYYALDYFASR